MSNSGTCTTCKWWQEHELCYYLECFLLLFGRFSLLVSMSHFNVPVSENYTNTTPGVQWWFRVGSDTSAPFLLCACWASFWFRWVSTVHIPGRPGGPAIPLVPVAPTNPRGPGGPGLPPTPGTPRDPVLPVLPCSGKGHRLSRDSINTYLYA